MQPFGLYLFLPEIYTKATSMAIVSVPPAPVPQPKACAICGVPLTPPKATAGMLDASGKQTYACVSHFMELEKLILGWADFTAQERQKYLRQGQEPTDLIYGGRHARSNP
jgi:hypothetical protein